MPKPAFHQFDCREQDRPDYRQARAVLKYRPDVIIFEMPEKNGKPDSLFNKYSPDKKPQGKVRTIQRSLGQAAKRFGYARSDIRTWQNIGRLWGEGHDVLLFNIDAPRELRSEWFDVWQNTYPSAMKNWVWWVHIYLRERIMANHLESILKEYKGKARPTIFIFLQSFHWKHVKFLISRPSKTQIWNYYFGKFPEVDRATIKGKIKKLNKTYFKYWEKYSDFK